MGFLISYTYLHSSAYTLSILVDMICKHVDTATGTINLPTQFPHFTYCELC